MLYGQLTRGVLLGNTEVKQHCHCHATCVKVGKTYNPPHASVLSDNQTAACCGLNSECNKQQLYSHTVH
jgi:hypothetical protein